MSNAPNTNDSTFEREQQWIADHYAELVERYAEEWIAVKDQQVIAHSNDLTQLLNQVPDLEHTCIEFIEQQAPLPENLTSSAGLPISSDV
ncbi:MAG: DUF5678 domain-containing protein [Anaerolineae bacterium]|nr:DUF5678 domain-containing protein [Thermoflexales bacterium]MDW8407917.1 DUF5678 domain-containing protein [Anaerolineae bacterium]